MTRMTEEELLNTSLKDLGFTVDHISEGRYKGEYILDHHEVGSHSNDSFMILVKDFGIELVKPEPEITQENLSRFYLVHKEFPRARFSDNVGGETGSVLYQVEAGGLGFIDHNKETWFNCEVIDQRWPDLEDKWKEYVKGVG